MFSLKAVGSLADCWRPRGNGAKNIMGWGVDAVVGFRILQRHVESSQQKAIPDVLAYPPTIPPPT
jgi:hypothetical protein